MEYLSVEETAEKWGVKPTAITYLCRSGKIDGAFKSGKAWKIPGNASMPADGRTKSAVTAARLPLPVGVSDYKDAVSNYYYVDKTLMIREIIDSLPKVSLFTRPRRFGKTLNMDMLRIFFEKSEENTSRYFTKMKIWQEGEKYRNYQGKYPVIFLSFKDVKFSTWQETLEKMKDLFQTEFLRHNVIVQGNTVLDEAELTYYHDIVNKTASEVALSAALQKLSKMLAEHYGIAPVIIVDEYDTPIQQGFGMGYYNEIIGFMRNLFSGAFKDNSYMSFGFLTGILRVAKESIFSGLNNLIENSVLSAHYTDYFGFTREEVLEMLRYYRVENRFDEVCAWYDGYRFGSSEIFNPWSVINYVHENCEPRAYWQNTGSNDILRRIVQESPADTKEKLHALLDGQSIVADVDSAVIYPEIQDNPQTVFSFLMIAGYLKVTEKLPSPTGNSFCRVAIPNREIQCIYGKEILSSIRNSAIQSSAVSIQLAILSQDAVALQAHLQTYLTQTISFLDADKEGFYHGLMLGLYAVMNNLYTVKSNREAGDGRFDIQMEPLDGKSAGILVELKVLRNPKDETETAVAEALDKLAAVALAQIDKKHYAQELRSRGVREILKFGIAFYKKQTAVALEKA